MAKVTCKETKEKIEKDTAFSIILKGRKTKSYFKDEETYNYYMEKSKITEEESDLWKQCKDLAVSLLDLRPEEKAPAYIFKKLHEIKKDRGTKYLLYLLNNEVKPNYGSFYRSNLGASLTYRSNMLIYFINNLDLPTFLKYSEKEILSILKETNTSEDFEIQSQAKRVNPLQKYFEEE